MKKKQHAHTHTKATYLKPLKLRLNPVFFLLFCSPDCQSEKLRSESTT